MRTPARLLPGELRSAPGVVRGDPFLRVLSLEQPLLQLTLQGETLLEANFQSGSDGALDEPDGARGLRRRHELSRVLERPGAELPRRGVDDGVDQPERLRLVDRKRRRFGHQLDRLRPPAQKNFSPAPVIITTCTAGSNRASSTCVSSSRIIS